VIVVVGANEVDVKEGSSIEVMKQRRELKLLVVHRKELDVQDVYNMLRSYLFTRESLLLSLHQQQNNDKQ